MGWGPRPDPGLRPRVVTSLVLLVWFSFWSAGAQDAGLQCPAGYETAYSHDGHTPKCLPCQVGSFDNGTSCEPCPPGTYNAYWAKVACQPCQDGSVSFLGSVECVLCPSGAVSSSDHTACAQCEAGKWSLPGDTSCRQCEPGTYNPIAGKPGCVECGRGFYNPNTGSFSKDSCVPCPAGYNCKDHITEKPTSCHSYHFSLAGAVYCHPCPSLFRALASHTGCEPTEAFYALVCGAGFVLLLCIACLIRCPSKDWRDVDSARLALADPSGLPDDDSEDSDDLYDDDEIIRRRR